MGLAILLGILKIIGIVILAVLGILLLVALYLLFLPVRLQLYAACEEDWTLRVKILGFLRFFQIHIEYLSGALDWSARAFWGRWTFLPRKEKPKGDVSHAPESDHGESGVADSDAVEPDAAEPDVAEPEEFGTGDVTERKADSTAEKSGSAETATGDEESAKKSVGVNQTERREEKKKKKDRPPSPSVRERMGSLKSQGITPEQRRAVSFLWGELLWYLKKIRPSLTEADGVYALGDPAWTGEFTGILSMWPGVYGDKIRLCPDFESDYIYFSGYLQLESRFFAIHLVRLLARVYFNQDCKKLFDL